ncbi:MAG: phosphopantothenate/pantothenate synthetase [archaeon]
MNIPKNHPRAESLNQRKMLEQGLKEGITVPAGLIAFGRGEALDYLLGEKTTTAARKAITAAAAMMMLSKKPILSVNGNTAAIAAKEIAQLSKTLNALVEVNIFYPPKKRRKLIAQKMKKFGVNALGTEPAKKIPGLSSSRSLVDKKGIWPADTVLLAIEDGDRTEALKKNGKKVIAIDLNPKSRTAKKADITIVDNALRAYPLLAKEAKRLQNKTTAKLKKIVEKFDNRKNLTESLAAIKRGA